jgi:hypothetical protein
LEPHRRNTRQEFRPVTAQSQITSLTDIVNAQTSEILEKTVPRLLSGALRGRGLKVGVWPVVLEIGRVLLVAALTMVCWRVISVRALGPACRLDPHASIEALARLFR